MHNPILVSILMIVYPLLISDHSLIQVTFSVSSVQTSTQNMLIWLRRRSTFHYDSFISELGQSCFDVTKLVKCYTARQVRTKSSGHVISLDQHGRDNSAANENCFMR